MRSIILFVGAVAFFGMSVWLVTLSLHGGASFAGVGAFALVVGAAMDWKGWL